MLANGKKIAEQILRQAKATIVKLRLRPSLAIILVGNNAASLTYIKRKQEAAKRIGIEVSVYKLANTITTSQVIKKIKSLSRQKLSGLIVQLPLPRKMDTRKILNSIPPELDVDFLTYTSLGQLASAENKLEPPTPSAILEVLKYYKVPIAGKEIVVVGRGWLIGRPLTNLLMKLPVTITVCGKSTKNLASHTRKADILISAVGKRNLIKASMIKKGAVVIDAGFVMYQGKICGDVDVKAVARKAKLVTPTPGGVGPITVAKLLYNVVANLK